MLVLLLFDIKLSYIGIGVIVKCCKLILLASEVLPPLTILHSLGYIPTKNTKVPNEQHSTSLFSLRGTTLNQRMKVGGGLESLVVEDVTKPVDREKTCPLLLRVFCATGRHNSVAEYSRGSVPQNELQIYTWMDATLRELTSLVKEVNPETRRKGTYFDFAIVYPDIRSPTYRSREIGVTCSGQRGSDDNKTLAQCKFQIGHYMDISITPPNRMPPPNMMRRPQHFNNNRSY